MDTSFLKSDIFFFVTTVAVVFLTIILAVLMIYVITIMRTIKSIARIAQSQAEVISEDIDDLRTEVKTRGASLKSLLAFGGRFAKRHAKARKK
jgi:predicted Holliday junction resolvase-like endonuclease